MDFARPNGRRISAFWTTKPLPGDQLDHLKAVGVVNCDALLAGG
jgi:hypothetical protein